MTPENMHFKHHIFCCGNERPTGHPRGCCKERGGENLRNYLRARIKEEGLEGIRVNNAGCMDRCEVGAVMVIYPEGIFYTYATQADVDEIIHSHLKKGQIVERLKLNAGQKELTPAQMDNRDKATGRDVLTVNTGS